MKTQRTMFVAAICLGVGLLLGMGLNAPKAPKYANALYGFQIDGPAFDQAERGMIVSMLGPSTGQFAPNINVMIQPRDTADGYEKLSRSQFESLKMTIDRVERRKIDGREALFMEYHGKMQGKDAHFLALAAFDKDRTLLVTCTALEDTFKAQKDIFEASISSFRFTTNN